MTTGGMPVESPITQPALPAQDIIERLKHNLHLHTDSDLANALGVTPQAISKARRLGRVPRRWVNLLQQPGGPKGQPSSGTRMKDSLLFIPQVMDRLSPEGTIQLQSSLAPYLPLATTFAASLGQPESMFAMAVKGDSMAPALLCGDTALVDQSQTQLHGFALYAVSIEGALFIRQVDLAPGKLILRCLNPRYEPLTADLAALQPCILGRVLWSCRRLL